MATATPLAPPPPQPLSSCGLGTSPAPPGAPRTTQLRPRQEPKPPLPDRNLPWLLAITSQDKVTFSDIWWRGQSGRK